MLFTLHSTQYTVHNAHYTTQKPDTQHTKHKTYFTIHNTQWTTHIVHYATLNAHDEWYECCLCVFAFCVKAKKNKTPPAAAPLFSELSILFISFLKFARTELHFLVTSFLFASGYRARYLPSKFAYASFFSDGFVFLGFNIPQFRQWFVHLDAFDNYPASIYRWATCDTGHFVVHYTLHTEWVLCNVTHRRDNILGTAQYISKRLWQAQYIAP